MQVSHEAALDVIFRILVHLCGRYFELKAIKTIYSLKLIYFNHYFYCNMSFTLEICVDSLKSALTAWRGGAQRLELCKDLSVGGLTPDAYLVKDIKKIVSIPVFVLIRCRPGNFSYTTAEVKKMVEEIQTMKNLGVDGLVFGALDKDSNVDLPVCEELFTAAGGIPVTFHRAFDEIKEQDKALESIIELGFKRVLTSGGPATAEEGMEKLSNLVVQSKYGERILIMPGGGVTDTNILAILKETKATEIHSSGRIADPDSPTLKSKVCSEKVIQNMRSILDHFAESE